VVCMGILHLTGSHFTQQTDLGSKWFALTLAHELEASNIHRVHIQYVLKLKNQTTFKNFPKIQDLYQIAASRINTPL